MYTKLLTFFNVICFLVLIACGTDNPKKNDNNQIVNANESLQKEIEERNSMISQVPQTLIMRVKLNSDEQPDFNNIEIRAINDKLESEDGATLAKAFESAQNLGEIATIDQVEQELNVDTSSQSCYGHHCASYSYNLPRRWGYILPWRQKVANAIYNDGYGSWPRRSGYLLPWRQRVANALYGYYNNYYWPYAPYSEYGSRYNSYVFYSLSSMWSSSSAWYYQNCGGYCGYRYSYQSYSYSSYWGY